MNYFILSVILLSNLVNSITVEVRDKGVNLNLDSTGEFSNENLNKDLKIIDNIQSFLRIVRKVLKTENYRRSIKDEELKFTDFLKQMLEVLIKLDDKYLGEVAKKAAYEMKNYHYKGCKFFEIMQKIRLKIYIDGKVKKLEEISPKKLKKKFKLFLSKLKNKDFKGKDLELLNNLDSIYGVDASNKMHDVLNEIEDLKPDIRHSETVKIIRNSIRSIIFDHYSNLNADKRKDVRKKLGKLVAEDVSDDNEKKVKKVRKKSAKKDSKPKSTSTTPGSLEEDKVKGDKSPGTTPGSLEDKKKPSKSPGTTPGSSEEDKKKPSKSPGTTPGSLEVDKEKESPELSSVQTTTPWNIEITEATTKFNKYKRIIDKLRKQKEEYRMEMEKVYVTTKTFSFKPFYKQKKTFGLNLDVLNKLRAQKKIKEAPPKASEVRSKLLINEKSIYKAHAQALPSFSHSARTSEDKIEKRKKEYGESIPISDNVSLYTLSPSSIQKFINDLMDTAQSVVNVKFVDKVGAHRPGEKDIVITRFDNQDEEVFRRFNIFKPKPSERVKYKESSKDFDAIQRRSYNLRLNSNDSNVKESTNLTKSGSKENILANNLTNPYLNSNKDSANKIHSTKDFKNAVHKKDNTTIASSTNGTIETTETVITTTSVINNFPLRTEIKQPIMPHLESTPNGKAVKLSYGENKSK